jgi:hypothetical protein
VSWLSLIVRITVAVTVMYTFKQIWIKKGAHTILKKKWNANNPKTDLNFVEILRYSLVIFLLYGEGED